MSRTGICTIGIAALCTIGGFFNSGLLLPDSSDADQAPSPSLAEEPQTPATGLSARRRATNAASIDTEIVDAAFDLAPVVSLSPRNRLDDPDPGVRIEAVDSLGALGGDEAIAGLGYALSDPNPTVRAITIEVLAELGNDAAVGAMALTLNDDDPELRELAVLELSDVGTEAAYLLLRRFLADSDRHIRELATEELEQAYSMTTNTGLL